MKKYFALFSISLLLSSCIVIKVYDTPKAENEAPKVIAKRQMMLPSDKMIPLPTGEQEICFSEMNFPLSPCCFKGKATL